MSEAEGGRICAIFTLSEMREFLKLLTPYLDNEVKEQVSAFLRTVRKNKTIRVERAE